MRSRWASLVLLCACSGHSAPSAPTPAPSGPIFPPVLAQFDWTAETPDGVLAQGRTAAGVNEGGRVIAADRPYMVEALGDGCVRSRVVRNFFGNDFVAPLAGQAVASDEVAFDLSFAVESDETVVEQLVGGRYQIQPSEGGFTLMVTEATHCVETSDSVGAAVCEPQAAPLTVTMSDEIHADLGEQQLNLTFAASFSSQDSGALCWAEVAN